MSGAGSDLITFRRRGSGLVIRVDCARWGQTPEDLRHLALSAPHARTRERALALSAPHARTRERALALSAPHARTRERALALLDITQHRCATQVAVRTGRRAHTAMEGVHASNQGGPAALTFRRTGGRRPFFARAAKPNSARWSAPPSARRPPHPSKGLIQPRAGPCAASSIGSASALG